VSPCILSTYDAPGHLVDAAGVLPVDWRQLTWSPCRAGGSGRRSPGNGSRLTGSYTRLVEPREPAFLTVSLEPNPTIEAYKRDVDRTLLRENLRLSVTARVRKMTAALRFAEVVRASRVKAGDP
jgi:hypothetical protein